MLRSLSLHRPGSAGALCCGFLPTPPLHAALPHAPSRLPTSGLTAEDKHTTLHAAHLQAPSDASPQVRATLALQLSSPASAGTSAARRAKLLQSATLSESLCGSTAKLPILRFAQSASAPCPSSRCQQFRSGFSGLRAPLTAPNGHPTQAAPMDSLGDAQVKFDTCLPCWHAQLQILGSRWIAVQISDLGLSHRSLVHLSSEGISHMPPGESQQVCATLFWQQGNYPCQCLQVRFGGFLICCIEQVTNSLQKPEPASVHSKCKKQSDSHDALCLI